MSAAPSRLEKWNAQLAYRSVVEATADKAGLDYLRQLVKNLAQSLNVHYAFVAEFAGERDRVRTLAYWGPDGWRPNVEFPLSGTPCERVVAGELCLFPDDVPKLFPRDIPLVKLGIRSYLGIPLRGAQGQALGHLAALDTEPMLESPRELELFEVFANRARVEMERLHAEEMLKSACRELEAKLEGKSRDLAAAQQSLDLAGSELKALLQINLSSARHLRRADLFAELARSVRPLLACERFGIEVPTGPESLRVHVLALDQPARGPMIEEFPSDGTACRWAQEQRQHYIAPSREALRARFPRTFAVMEREGMESLCALPLQREERSFGALFFMSTLRDAYREIPTALLDRVASAIAVALDNCMAYERLAELSEKLRVENAYLQEEIRQTRDSGGGVVGRSGSLEKVLALVDTLAPANATVLIQGETGTGKELIARALHERSPRSAHPLVKVNCAAISAGLVESELFGHVRGAFTGATANRVGRFEVANGGTLFLDEVGELPLDTQVKLLRVLQEREIEPVGSNQSRKVDVRVIAATNRDLAAEVAAGRFRSDLFFRLNVVPLTVPPLRERDGDVELLALYFAERFSRELGKRFEGISAASLARLRAYDWPGNVRELSNVIERAVVLSRGGVLEVGDELATARPAAPGTPSPLSAPAQPDGAETLEAAQRRHIQRALEDTGWKLEGASGAAARLGLAASTLRSRMKKLGIRREG